MPKCEHCGKEVILPYKCSFCGHYFCVEHRLPENHSCPNFPPTSRVEEKFVSKGESYFVKETVNMQTTEELKPKGKLKYLIPIFCILLTLVSCVSYSFGYSNGYNASLDMGYNLGYTQGYAAGNLTGYQLGYINGNVSGYEQGFEDGYLKGVIDGAGTGYNIRDPTYQEMLDFLTSDKTDKNEYSENYTCFHFTADTKNNAFRAGYRCGFVHIRFPDSAHAIVCFNTTDQGLIFIEPQLDDMVTLIIGQSYSELNGYEKPDYNDTIINFTIIW